MKKNTLKLQCFLFLLLFSCLSLTAEQIIITIDSRDPDTDSNIGTIQEPGPNPLFSNLKQIILQADPAIDITEITNLKIITNGTYKYTDSREIPISIEPNDFILLNSLPKLAKLDLSDATTTGRANNNVDYSFPRNAFDGNMSMKSIILPKNMTGLARGAFSNTALEGTFTISKSVTSVAEYDMIFGGSKGITGFEVEAGNTHLKTNDGILYTADGKTLLIYPYGKTGTSFSIPEGVTTVGTSAFGWNNYLEEITISSTVTTLPRQDKIINNSPNVKAVYVAEGNTRYGSTNGFLVDKETSTLMAFPPANTDETIVIDGSIVKNVPNNYFSYAVANLKNIIFTEGVEVIGYSAFKIGFEVTSVLEYVELPSTIKNIEGEAFVGNANLLQVICKAAEPPVLTPNQVFRGSNGKDVRLGVPSGSVGAYKASTWNINNSASTNAFPEEQIVSYGNITMENGTCLQSAATPNFQVKVVADEAPDGQAFSGWVTEPAAGFVNPKASVGIFTMPNSDITVRATFSPKMPYTLIDALNPSGEAAVGAIVDIEAAPVKDGQLFRSWEVVEGNGLVIDNPNAVSTSFTMVEGPVTIAARYATAYMINISGGMAVLEAFENETVAIQALPKAGQEFVNWTSNTPHVAFADANSIATTFVMPASEVDITANYIPATGIEEFTSDVSLFPNPATEFIRIENASNEEYIIYNLSGNVVAKGIVDGAPVSVRELPGGVYLLKMNDRVLRFIKK